MYREMGWRTGLKMGDVCAYVRVPTSKASKRASVPAQNSSTTSALSVDLINSTCKECADKSTILSFGFCLTSLQAIPVGHATNLQGLALVTMELALQNATDTISSIEKMLIGGAFDPFAIGCLEDCFELSEDAVQMLVNSIRAFLSEHYDAANVLMTAVMEAAATCEEGFMEKEGEASPLTKENYNLFELSDIALCIINLLSFHF
ncbi:hypothetical protein F0562_012579 [Nyssa sinensis]|uniref:Pectinesterase inhibitor domain-containing protein n=1 Tax=Nyssa sinensis TaxID=561372 RepID=A0A5J4ZYJ7_9ASTE|nr:hypothetical protein F0562_012579 [Nyssa sinensis]